jgi:hypothetical protein
LKRHLYGLCPAPTPTRVSVPTCPSQEINPHLTSFLYFILSYPSPSFPRSCTPHLPSFILSSLSLLIITFSSSSSHYHSADPMVALQMPIYFTLFLHVRDTISPFAGWSLPPSPTGSLSHYLSSIDCLPFRHWSAKTPPCPTNSDIYTRYFACGLFISVIMEARHTFDMSVNSNENTQCYIPEGCHLHTYHLINLKSHLILTKFFPQLTEEE